jgi:hypothetical protein
VFRLVEEADVIERVHTALRAGESTRSLHLAFQAQPSWLFHGHPTALPTALASAVRGTRYEVEPIRACVQSISAIPTPEAIARAVRASIGHGTTDGARPIPGEMWEPIEPLEVPSPI